MAESTSPKSSSGVFAKKVQRQLSRGKEKVLQRLGRTVETRDDQFEQSLQNFVDQQTDGNRIYKDLRHYINSVRGNKKFLRMLLLVFCTSLMNCPAITDMREASRRLSQSLFDAYENDWAAGEDLGAIVEGEDLLWNDYEVKLIDQAIRTMESYVSQFPDVKEKVAKRGRKLVDYDSSLHHLEALQTAKKRDDVKINKADEEMHAAKSVYESINSELKEELPQLYDSRIGCYVSVFSALSNLRQTFYKEMCTLNQDLHSVVKELQAQYPDKVFAVRGMQKYGSLKRRTLMSPKAWKASFSEYHKGYSPRPSQRFSFKSPDKSRHSTLSRESSTSSVSPPSSILESPSSESRDLDAESNNTEPPSSPAQEEAAEGSEVKSEEDRGQVEEEKSVKEEEVEPPAESDNKGDGEKAPPSDSSSELNNSCDSESLDLQLSAADVGPLHIEEREDSPVLLGTPKANRLENGEVSGVDSDTKEDAVSPDVKNTTV
ncbi:bridging integrator 2a [Xyrichtys novacula]|uniref:Bridging integrator 2a n=1 Tax=Xyrichtys novacula TaxID=13765 RepID=A0AAV1HG61_XYRNO|nr:bridging integrator 2a [Xyrichtys novacula]